MTRGVGGGVRVPVLRHSGDRPDRRAVEERWSSDAGRLIVVCTSGLPVGTDRRTVGLVGVVGRHSSVQLAQYAGRAGRDDEDSVVVFVEPVTEGGPQDECLRLQLARGMIGEATESGCMNERAKCSVCAGWAETAGVERRWMPGAIELVRDVPRDQCISCSLFERRLVAAHRGPDGEVVPCTSRRLSVQLRGRLDAGYGVDMRHHCVYCLFITSAETHAPLHPDEPQRVVCDRQHVARFGHVHRAFAHALHAMPDWFTGPLARLALHIRTQATGHEVATLIFNRSRSDNRAHQGVGYPVLIVYMAWRELLHMVRR